MSAEYRLPKPGYQLVAVKRWWIPERAFSMFKWVICYQPFRWIFTQPIFSAKEQCILDLLADGQWWYGLDLIACSGGVLRRGTVYLVLAELEEKGWIEACQTQELDPNVIPRRMYRKSP